MIKRRHFERQAPPVSSSYITSRKLPKSSNTKIFISSEHDWSNVVFLFGYEDVRPRSRSVNATARYVNAFESDFSDRSLIGPQTVSGTGDQSLVCTPAVLSSLTCPRSRTEPMKLKRWAAGR